METYKYICACGNLVIRRSKTLKTVSCFDCKEKRQRMAAMQYRPRSGEDKIAFEKRTQERRDRIAMTKEKNAEIIREREFKIVEMRLDNKTLEYIGQNIEPKRTRERVRQILARITRREGIVFEKQHAHKADSSIKTPCIICGDEMKLWPKYFRGHGKHRHQKCIKSQYVKEDGTPMTKAEKFKWIYWNNPQRKANMNRAMRDRYYRIKADPEKYAKLKEQNKVYIKTWLEKKRKDPAYIAKQREKGRERWKAMRNDPVKWAHYLEKERIRNQKHLKKISPPDPLSEKDT